MSENSNKKIVTGGLIWSYGERITAQLVSLIVSIILARVLEPDHYGVVSIVMIFITFFNAFVTGGFGNSLVQKKDADELDFNTMLYCSIVVSIILYAILFMSAPYIASFYSMPIICPVLRVLGVRIIISGINSIQHAWIQKKLEFKKFFLATLLGTVSSAFIGISLAYFGFGVWALVVQYLTNTIIDTIVLFFVDNWRPRPIFSWIRAKKLLLYGWKVLVTTLIYTITANLRSLIIGKRFGSSNLAFYDQGKKFPDLIVSNINTSISKVMFPVLANNQDNLLKMKQMCRKSTSIGVYLLAPLLIGLISVADVFVEVVLSTKWLPCVPYLQILAMVFLVRPMTTTCQQAIMSIGRSDITLKIELIINAIGIILLCIAVFFLNSVLMVAYGNLLTEIVSFVLFMIYSNKYINYTYREQINDIAPSLALSCLMGMLIYFMNFIRINKIVLLIVQVIIGISVYIGTSYLLQLEPFIYLVNIFNGMIHNKRIKYILNKFSRNKVALK